MKNKALPKGLKLSDAQNQLVAKLYQTEIVTLNDNRLTLRSGGWFTMHTKKCINLVSDRFDLGLKVSQVKGEWLVSFRDGKVVPFVDGMEISI